MIVAGRACLVLALAICLYGVAASLYGARARRREWVDSGRRAVYALAGTVLVAFAVLEVAFVRSDFSFALVASHSSTTTPFLYRLAAPWSSQEGSLLLWILLLSLWSSLILFLSRRRAREIAPYATAVLLGFGTFFCSLLVFMETPFGRLVPTPAEGVGLNPLLRHPSMMIHPPMLYSGYTLFAVPFAFAVGALVTRRLNADWIRVTRPFTLAAWLFLGIGVVLGARWSYSELGWGGYWAWDPVENASLMPWLTGTAFLHSVMIQERRGMLKIWNVSLILTTGVLAVLGTFLVRSGILQSIHAFGASTLGVPFLALIVAMIAGSVALVSARASDLRSEHSLDSLISREAVFLLNNLVLVGLCFVVFWGTFFPLISEAITGQQASVGPPWFNRYITPLALVLVLLSGVGPVIAWRRATPANLRRAFALPGAAGALVAVLLVVAGVTESATALIMFVLGAFVVAAVGQEYWRGVRARRAMSGDSVPRALVALVRRNRRRYGGYLVHVGDGRPVRGGRGVVGIPARARRPSGTGADGPGGRLRRSPTRAPRAGWSPRPTAGWSASTSAPTLVVRRDGHKVGVLHTHRSYFPTMDPTLGPVSRYFEGNATSEVGLRAGLRRDLWSAIQPDLSSLRRLIGEGDKVFDQAGTSLSPSMRYLALATALKGLTDRYRAAPPPATFRLLISPLVSWIWLGALIVFAGGLICLWPAARGPLPARAAYKARVARELQHA